MRLAHRTVWALPVVIALVAGVVAGDEPRRERVVFSIDLRAPRVVAPPIEAAVRRLAGVLERELGLPMPPRVTLYVYGSRERFRQGLVLDAAVAPAVAAAYADFALGVAVPQTFFLRAGGPEWLKGDDTLRLIAHELAHLGQIELAHGEGRGVQWLAEGMAEWSAFAALDRLRAGTLAGYRLAVLPGVRAQVTAWPRLDLAGLDAPAEFLARHRRDGTLATYHLAFALVDYLVGRNGWPAMLDYYRAFETSTNADENFVSAFGLTVDAFEREVVVHLTAPRV
ncbi:MAG: hypothetical protein HYR51_16905 [Candidatus Rokubacteria bacterium]|nr:hypothetical protein [Candidatus Rokubacteria bacterium]